MRDKPLHDFHSPDSRNHQCAEQSIVSGSLLSVMVHFLYCLAQPHGTVGRSRDVYSVKVWSSGSIGA
jgi:hypothetical protein